MNIKLCAQSPSGCQEQNIKNQEKGNRCAGSANTLQGQEETNSEHVPVYQIL